MFSHKKRVLVTICATFHWVISIYWLKYVKYVFWQKISTAYGVIYLQKYIPMIVFNGAIATTSIAKLVCDIKTFPTPLHAWPNQLLTLCLFQLFWVIDRQRLWWKTYFLRIIVLMFLFTGPLTFSHWRQLKS